MATLRLALTLARLLVAQSLRHLAVTAGLWALALLFLMLGFLGLAAALWIWLAQALGPILAALIIGGGGLATAILLMLIAKSRRPPSLLSSSVAADLQSTFKDRKADLDIWAPLIGIALLGFLLGGKSRD